MAGGTTFDYFVAQAFNERAHSHSGALSDSPSLFEEKLLPAPCRHSFVENFVENKTMVQDLCIFNTDQS